MSPPERRWPPRIWMNFRHVPVGAPPDSPVSAPHTVQTQPAIHTHPSNQIEKTRGMGCLRIPRNSIRCLVFPGQGTKVPARNHSGTLHSRSVDVMDNAPHTGFELRSGVARMRLLA